jgi:putative glutamine amidotransferase
MAVDDVAGFAVTARCPDGVVEAISATDWLARHAIHPESDSASQLTCEFEEFISRTGEG